MHRWMILLTAVLFGLAALAGNPTRAQQEGFNGVGRYRIEIAASGKSLDLKLEDKKTVQQWGTSGSRNQQWDVEDAGGGFYFIRAVENRLLLDFADNRARDGAAVIVAAQSNSDHQRWKIEDYGNSQFTITSRSGKALELQPGRQRDDGGRMQAGTPHGLENQRYRLTRIGEIEMPSRGTRPRDGGVIAGPTPADNTRYNGPGRYSIQVVSSQRYLDLKLEDLETLQQWSGGGARNQQWDVEDAGGGFVYLRSAENGKGLEVADRRPRDGSLVLARAANTSDAQKWRIVERTNGEYGIISRLGKALDLSNNSLEDGGKLWVWQEHSEANQRFRFGKQAQGETYTGGRTRGERGATPTPTPTPTPEPYTPGSLRWRGRVDIEVLLDVRGNTVTERNLTTGRTFNNGQFNFSAPMPKRELTVRVRNIKVRGTVQIAEQPSAANNWTAVIRVSDPKKDAADYEFELSW